MPNTRHNAEAFIALLERLRHLPMGPAFSDLFKLGLTPTHLRAMYILRQNPALPMKELAEALAMTPPSVTVLTRRLQTLKLLDRQNDPVDSRRVLLALSAQGADMLDQMHNAHLTRFTQLLGGLSVAEQAQFLDLMSRAVTALERSAGTACAPTEAPLG
jgi:DNA-binding MarR family transcriptional regulator